MDPAKGFDFSLPQRKVDVGDRRQPQPLNFAEISKIRVLLGQRQNSKDVSG